MSSQIDLEFQEGRFRSVTLADIAHVNIFIGPNKSGISKELKKTEVARKIIQLSNDMSPDRARDAWITGPGGPHLRDSIRSIIDTIKQANR